MSDAHGWTSGIVGMAGLLVGWLRRSRKPVDPAPLRLETERLILRNLEMDDWPAVHAYYSDAEVCRYLAQSRPESEEEVRRGIAADRFHRRLHGSAYVRLGIVLASESRVVGECTLVRISAEPAVSTLGFLMLRSEWGKGYATEAACGLLLYAFLELNVPRVVAGCHPENVPSRRVLEKLGMRYDGLRKGFPGSLPGMASHAFSMERSEWIRTRPGGLAAGGQTGEERGRELET